MIEQHGELFANGEIDLREEARPEQDQAGQVRLVASGAGDRELRGPARPARKTGAPACSSVARLRNRSRSSRACSYEATWPRGPPLSGAAPIRRVDGDPAIGEMHRDLGEPGSVAGDPVEKEQGRFSLAADEVPGAVVQREAVGRGQTRATRHVPIGGGQRTAGVSSDRVDSGAFRSIIGHGPRVLVRRPCYRSESRIGDHGA